MITDTVSKAVQALRRWLDTRVGGAVVGVAVVGGRSRPCRSEEQNSNQLHTVLGRRQSEVFVEKVGRCEYARLGMPT